ncbi:MAG: nuclease-related domain-containing protein [Anaerosomatales bacterium]|nr:nuclease-related domain-containing protein [Anaerosomatales bacterium]
MACFIGEAGIGAAKEGITRQRWTLVFAFVMAIALVVWLQQTLRTAGFFIAVMLLAAFAVVMRRHVTEYLRTLRQDLLPWIKGAGGEIAVVKALAELPDNYLVFNDYHPFKNGKRVDWNVDHVVIGPTGIFVLDAKNYTRTRIEPAEKDPYHAKNVRQADRNAREFKKAITTWSGGQLAAQFVVGVVVYTQPDAFIVKLREGFTRVIPLRWLVSEIIEHPAGELKAEQAYRIARVLYSQLPPAYRHPWQDQLDKFGAAVRHERELQRNKHEPSSPEARTRRSAQPTS